jgi:serine/threonine-protein kinase
LSDTANYFSFKSSLYRLHHQPALERAYADSGRRVWEAQEKDRPDDPGPHNALGFIYAQLGRKVEAIREGQRAVELLPVSKDALLGPKVVDNLAQIYMIVGEPDAAIHRLEYLLSIPSLVSVGLLQADPLWDPLRRNPRFQRLLGGKQ